MSFSLILYVDCRRWKPVLPGYWLRIAKDYLWFCLFMPVFLVVGLVALKAEPVSVLMVPGEVKTLTLQLKEKPGEILCESDVIPLKSHHPWVRIRSAHLVPETGVEEERLLEITLDHLSAQDIPFGVSTLIRDNEDCELLKVETDEGCPGDVTVTVKGSVVTIVRNGVTSSFAVTSRTLDQTRQQGHFPFSDSELSGKRVLDLAAGKGGLVTKDLRSKSVDACGMDIAFAGEGVDASYLKQADIAGSIPFEGQFDIVFEVYGGIIYGLGKCEPQAVRNALRAVKPGGVLILSPVNKATGERLEKYFPPTDFTVEKIALSGANTHRWMIRRVSQ